MLQRMKTIERLHKAGSARKSRDVVWTGICARRCRQLQPTGYRTDCSLP